jgi:hypothetical protein
VGKRVNGGSRHAKTGRVTSPKLRRAAVIAVDGVLAVGTGAVAGLFSTGGVASATAPTPGWTGAQTPLPGGPDAPESPAFTVLGSTSCSSAVLCADVGFYRGAGGLQHPLLDVWSGGTWTAEEAPLPANGDSTLDADLFSVSCNSTAACVAVGDYRDVTPSHLTHGLIETLSGGHWSALEAPVPVVGVTEVDFKSVDCQSATSCLAVGGYVVGSGEFGVIDTYNGAGWSSQTAPQPNDATTHQTVGINDVSCPSVGPCAAGGAYESPTSEQGILWNQAADGTWSEEVAPLPNGAATGSAAQSGINAISCSGGVCGAVGEFEDASHHERGLLERYAGGVWTPSMAPEPLNAGSGSNQFANLQSVSCTFDGVCTSVGGYTDQANDASRALIVSDNGSTTTATEGPQPGDAATGASIDAGFNSVSCLSAAYCTAVGTYANNSGSGSDVALLDQETNGSWSNVVAPLPGNAATGSHAVSDLNSVSCTTRGACNAAGSFTDTPAGNQFGFDTAYTPAQGYWENATDGGVFTYGNAVFHGSTGNIRLNQPMVGMAETPGPGGYWEVASDGGVFSFGNALFHGSAGNIHLNAPVVGMAATPDGLGYWLVASDGGVFNYGDALFYGSTGNVRLNKPIVGIAATPDGHGYWLVASDGGVFNYGDAGFFGSAGALPLNKPVVGVASTASGLGYWLVASDGGIFNYGDARFLGSTGNLRLNKPVVGMMSTFDGGGYWLVASDGGIFSYGNTSFWGSTGNIVLNAPVVGGSPT